MQKLFIYLVLISSVMLQGSQPFKSREDLLLAISNILYNSQPGMIETTTLTVPCAPNNDTQKVVAFVFWKLTTTTNIAQMRIARDFNVKITNNGSIQIPKISVFEFWDQNLINNEYITTQEIMDIVNRSSLPFSILAVTSRILHGIQPGKITSFPGREFSIDMYDENGMIQRVHQLSAAR